MAVGVFISSKSYKTKISLKNTVKSTQIYVLLHIFQRHPIGRIGKLWRDDSDTPALKDT